jgi:hypothetical protein
MTVKVAVIYYSATGGVYALAQAVAKSATSAGPRCSPDAAALETVRCQGRRLAHITNRLLERGRTEAAAGDGTAREAMAATTFQAA